MQESNVLIERKKADFHLYLFEFRDVRTDKKTWSIRMHDDAPYDLDTWIEIWFVDQYAAMAIFEMICRHGLFDKKSAQKN